MARAPLRLRQGSLEQTQAVRRDGRGVPMADVQRAPSARLLAELRSTGESFVELALRKQRDIEAKDRISFEAYLANCFSDLPAQSLN